MNASAFVTALSNIELQGVFNPYRHRCQIHDLEDGPEVRRKNLQLYLEALEQLGVDTIWMGRDLGYRGGRRTGLALTDEFHLPSVSSAYPGAKASKATKGPIVNERTAGEVWSILIHLAHPPLLWNVFPFHPHELSHQFSNRRFTKQELAEVTGLNSSLVSWLGIKRIISIGQDAASYASRFGVQIECVRHPSYGGVREFRTGMNKIYGMSFESVQRQNELFDCKF